MPALGAEVLKIIILHLLTTALYTGGVPSTLVVYIKVTLALCFEAVVCVLFGAVPYITPAGYSSLL